MAVYIPLMPPGIAGGCCCGVVGMLQQDMHGSNLGNKLKHTLLFAHISSSVAKRVFLVHTLTTELCHRSHGCGFCFSKRGRK